VVGSKTQIMKPLIAVVSHTEINRFGVLANNISVIYIESVEKAGGLTMTGSTGFCGHVFSGAYELKNDLESGSGKSFEDISVIPEPENS